MAQRPVLVFIGWGRTIARQRYRRMIIEPFANARHGSGALGVIIEAGER
jgi:hypothetical protein